MHLVLGVIVVDWAGSRMPASTLHEVPASVLGFAFPSANRCLKEKSCPKEKPLEASAIKNTQQINVLLKITVVSVTRLNGIYFRQ